MELPGMLPDIGAPANIIPQYPGNSNNKQAALREEVKRNRTSGTRRIDGYLYSSYARRVEDTRDMQEKLRSRIGSLYPEDEKLKKRLDRTLARLRQDGYCTEKNIDDLISRTGELMPEAYFMIPVLLPDYTYINVYRPEINNLMRNYGDDLWKQAIELSIAISDPEKLSMISNSSSTLYGPAVEHINEIYLNYFSKLFLSGINRVYDRCFDLEDENRKIKKRTDKATQKLREAEAVNRNIEIQRHTLQMKVVRLEAEKEALQKELRTMQAQLRSVNADVSKSDTEPEPEISSNDLVQTKDEEPEGANNKHHTENEYELYRDIHVPDDESIIFLGGIQNFTKKVRRLHPHWRYISTDNWKSIGITRNAGTKIQCVIFYSKHISHTLYQNIMDPLKDVPVIYIDCQNIEKMEHIIRRDYARKVLELKDDQLAAVKINSTM